MPAGLKSSPWLPCRKRQGCFCGHVPKRTRHQRAPAKHEAYQCSNLDLPPKRCPCPDRHTAGPLGRPPDCFPRAIRKTLVRRFHWSAHSHDFAHNCFYMSCFGRKQPEPSRPDASPSVRSDPARPNRRRTVQVENMRGLSYAQTSLP